MRDSAINAKMPKKKKLLIVPGELFVLSCAKNESNLLSFPAVIKKISDVLFLYQ